MFHWKPRTLLLRLVLPALVLGVSGTGAALLTLPSPASALPVSATQCAGSLSADPTGPSQGEPDLLDYGFYCSTPITAYTVLVNRVRNDNDNVDDFNPNPSVDVANSGGQPSPTESVNCGGATPSNGINCYSLVGSVAGPIAPGDDISGSIDLTNQYCSYLLKGAKPGTPSVPRATVELIVTDTTGAEDGPFELFPTKACAKVPAVVPTPKTTKKTTTKAKPKTTKRVKPASAVTPADRAATRK